MNINKKEEKIILSALDTWENHGDISPEDKERLTNKLHVMSFDWRRLSLYCFWMASICALIALITLFYDNQLMAYLINLFYNSFTIRIGLPTLIAIGCYGYGFYRQSKEIYWHYSTESLIFLGVICTAIAIWQLGILLDDGSGHIARLLLLACAIYGVIGFCARSGLIWLFFLISLGNWFGAETGYASGWGMYWLGMNYPVRFVVFGCVLLGLCFALKSLLEQRHLFIVSKVMGLLYLFIALWMLSIFGNYGDQWVHTTYTLLLPWVFVFLVAALICIYISFKTDDGMLRGFGLTFLGINIYTRFFEHFWGDLHKVLFFLILAISLAIIGRYAERIWHAELSNSRALDE